MTRQHEYTDQFVETMRSADGAVSLQRFVDETDVEDRDEAKEVLRVMMDREMITTTDDETPGWKYRLPSHI